MHYYLSFDPKFSHFLSHVCDERAYQRVGHTEVSEPGGHPEYRHGGVADPCPQDGGGSADCRNRTVIVQGGQEYRDKGVAYEFGQTEQTVMVDEIT